MATRISAKTNKETGKTDVAIEEVDPTPLEEAEEALVTSAAERLARLKKRRNKPEWVPFNCAGEDVLIKSLTLHEQVELALSVARDGVNVLQITDEVGANAVNIAIIVACVYDAPGKRSFTKEDAEIYAASPDATEFMGLLLQRSLEINDTILTTLKKT